MRLDQRLRECDYGDLNGASVEQVATQCRHRVDEPFPGGESYRQVVERMRSFFDDVAAVHDGERIVVVAHSANRWALDHLVGRRPLGELVGEPFEWQEGLLYVVRANASSSSSVIE